MSGTAPSTARKEMFCATVFNPQEVEENLLYLVTPLIDMVVKVKGNSSIYVESRLRLSQVSFFSSLLPCLRVCVSACLRAFLPSFLPSSLPPSLPPFLGECPHKITQEDSLINRNQILISFTDYSCVGLAPSPSQSEVAIMQCAKPGNVLMCLVL